MISHLNIQYHLDKDILQEGIPTNMKKYSPETCMFIPARENISRLLITMINLIINISVFMNMVIVHIGL